MKRSWTEEELIERWTLAPDELPLLANKSGGYSARFCQSCCSFFAGEGRFPTSRNEVPGQVVAYIGNQVGVPADEYPSYDWQGRTIKYHRAQIREFFGFREITEEDGEQIASWLVEEVLPGEPGAGETGRGLLSAVLGYQDRASFFRTGRAARFFGEAPFREGLLRVCFWTAAG